MDGATSGGGEVVVLCIATHDQLTMEATPRSPSGSVRSPPPSPKPHLLQLFHSDNPIQTVALGEDLSRDKSASHSNNSLHKVSANSA